MTADDPSLSTESSHRLSATVETTCLDVNQEYVTLALGFSNARAEIRDPQLKLDASAVKALARAIETTLCLRVSRNGALQAIAFPEGLEMPLRNQLKTLVCATRFVLMPAGSRVWTAIEEEPTGSFECAYRAFAGVEAGTTIVIKTFECIPPAPSTLPGAPRPEYAATGEVRGCFDERLGLFRTVDGKRCVETSLPGTPVKVRSSTSVTYALSAVDEVQDLSGELAFSPTSTWTENLALESLPIDATDQEQRIASTLSFPTLMTSLEGALARPGKEGFSGAVEELRILFRHDAAALAEAANRLRDPEFPILTAVGLIHAIGLAGTPQAQGHLVDLIATPGIPAHTRTVAVTSLMAVDELVPGLSPRLEEAWRTCSASEDESATVILEGIGALSDRYAKGGDAGEADRIARFLVATYQDDSTPISASASVVALGNAGRELALPLLLREVGSPVETTRTAATYALRKMPPSRVQGLLLGLADRDECDGVRAAAVAALAVQGASGTDERMAGWIEQDRSPSVRREAMDWFTFKSTATIERRRAILEKVAARDPSEDLRRLARQALDQVK